MKKKLLLSLMSLVSVAFLAGCNPSSSSTSAPSSSQTSSSVSTSSTVTVKTITINNKADITKTWHSGDESRVLDLSSDPVTNIPTAIANGSITITSSNPKVVSTSGLYLYPMAAGTATITVACGNVKDTVDIVVIDFITLTPTNNVISLGAADKTVSFTISSTGEKTNLTDFNWKSSDETVATVKDGVVTGLKAGKVTITATQKELETNFATYDITVVEGIEKITDISTVTTDSIKNLITVDGEIVAKTTKGFLVSDGDAAIYVYLNVAPNEYAIGDHVKVSTVNENGQVTGGGSYNGLPQFTATASVVKLSSKFSGTIPAATELTPQIADSFDDGDLSTSDVKKYKWSTVSSVQGGGYVTLNVDGASVDIENSYTDPNLFTVESGKYYDVEAYFAGYSSSSSYAAVYITKITEKEVTETKFTLGRAEVKGFVGTKTTVYTGLVVPEGTTKPEITFSSDNPEVATVEPEKEKDDAGTETNTGNMIINFVAPGTATITAKAGNITKTCKVTVEAAVGEPDVQVVDLEDVIAANDTNGQFLYITEGIATNVKGDKYGGMDLAVSEEENAASIQVYGSTASVDSITYDMASKKYKFKNPQDFATNEDTKEIKDGDKLKVAVIRADYKDTKEVNAIILGINGTPISNGTATSDDFYNKEVEKYATYTITGKISAWYSGKEDGTKYGNFYLKTEGSEHEALVYGATATAGSLIFGSQGDIYHLDSPQDFLTNDMTKDLDIGDAVTMQAFYDEFNGTPEIIGIILSVDTGAAA